MYCQRCGAENPDDVQFCNSCGSVLTPFAQTNAGLITTKTSGMAIAALVLGILSFLLGIITGLPAFILGIISLINIEKSGGRLTGKGFAITGIVTPIFSFVFLIFVILFPALSRTRQIAFRMVCGTNLSGLGKAMLLYANDYDDELPMSGGRNRTWGPKIHNWSAQTRNEAYGLDSDGSGGNGSISSSLYLLVKYCEVTPKSFICKGDFGATEFKPYAYDAGNIDINQLWDFGPNPREHCSYSYQQPFTPLALTTSSEPGMAVAADPNPWLDKKAAGIRDFSRFDVTGGRQITKLGNTITHQYEGQNVLYLDSHVEFESVPFCGVNEDNIYTQGKDNGDIKKGVKPINGGALPLNRSDNLLIMD
jgi:hypothetical protein